MEEEQVFKWVGAIHLMQWGDPDQAVKLIGELADFRASLMGNETANFQDVRNLLFKLCDWWPWKPQDWKTVMAELRPLLLERIEYAKMVFTEDFIKLEYYDAVEMFRDRLSLFSPNGNIQVINTSVTDGLGVRVPHGGRAIVLGQAK